MRSENWIQIPALSCCFRRQREPSFHVSHLDSVRRDDVAKFRVKAREKASRVVTALHGLLLAIEHAAVALRRRFNIEDLEQIINDEVKLALNLNKKPASAEWAYNKNKPLYAILDYLAAQLTNESPVATSVFTWIAFLGPGEISRHALLPFGFIPGQQADPSQCLWNQITHGFTDLPEISVHLLNATKEPVLLWESVRLLERSCMLTIRRDSDDEIQSVLLHNTVQKWAVARAGIKEQQLTTLFSAYNLGQSFKGLQAAETALVLHRNLDLPVLNVLTKYHKYVKPAIGSDGHGKLSDGWRKSANWLGKQLVAMQHFEQAQSLLEELVEYDKTVQALEWPRDEESLELLEDLGDCHRDWGQFEVARDKYTDLIDKCRAIPKDLGPMVDRISEKLQNMRKKIYVHTSILRRDFGSTKAVESSPFGWTTVSTPDSGMDRTGAELSANLLWDWFSKEDQPTNFPFVDTRLHRHFQNANEEGFQSLDTKASAILKGAGLLYYEHQRFWRAAACLTAYWSAGSLPYPSPNDPSFDGPSSSTTPSSTTTIETGLNTLVDCFARISQPLRTLPNKAQALMLACDQGDFKLCKILIEEADLPFSDSRQKFMARAVSLAETDIVQFLLRDDRSQIDLDNLLTRNPDIQPDVFDLFGR